ncbi:hypothetical protein ABZY45_14060 [Streptomyces sp. NPDC006516]|uniref:hypothetical protein n=1 Tax=Streptomyces sp. NPDC006516 TaxID=3154309 RepID=UPI0033B23AF8
MAAGPGDDLDDQVGLESRVRLSACASLTEDGCEEEQEASRRLAEVIAAAARRDGGA